QQVWPHRHAVGDDRGEDGVLPGGVGIPGREREEVGRRLARADGAEVGYAVGRGTPAPAHVGAKAGDVTTRHAHRDPHGSGIAVVLDFAAVPVPDADGVAPTGPVIAIH